MDLQYFQDLLNKYKGLNSTNANPLLDTSSDQVSEDVDALKLAEQQGHPIMSDQPAIKEKKEQEAEDKAALAFYAQNSEGPQFNEDYANRLDRRVAAEKPLINQPLPSAGPSMPDTAIGAMQSQAAPSTSPRLLADTALAQKDITVQQPLMAPAAAPAPVVVPAAQKPLIPKAVPAAAPQPVSEAPKPTEPVAATPAPIDPMQKLLDEYEQAKQLRNRDLEYAKWADVGGTIDQAIRGKGNPLEDFSKGLRERSGMYQKDVTAKQDLLIKAQDQLIKQEEMAAKKSKAEYDKTLKDPNSTLSKAYREVYKSMGYNFGEGLSAYDAKNNDDLRQLIEKKASLDVSRDNARTNAEMRKEMQDQRQSQRNVQNMGRYQDAYNKDKLVQDTEKRLEASEDALALLSTNNPIADEAAKRKIARLSGEVGVLTDADVASFGGSRAWLNRIQSVVDRGAYGTLTPEDRKLMLAMSQTLKEKAENQLTERAEHFAAQGAKRFGMDKEEAYDYLRPGKAMSTKKQTSEAQSVDAQGVGQVSGLTPEQRRKRIEELKAKQGMK